MALVILFVPGVERIDGRAYGYVFPVLLLLTYAGKWVIHRENRGRGSSRIFRRHNAHQSQGPVCRGDSESLGCCDVCHRSVLYESCKHIRSYQRPQEVL